MTEHEPEGLRAAVEARAELKEVYRVWSEKRANLSDLTRRLDENARQIADLALAASEADRATAGEREAAALHSAASDLRENARNGYLFLATGSQRVPWKDVSEWLDERARKADLKRLCRCCGLRIPADPRDRENVSAELVTISAAEWEEARCAFEDVTALQDANANAEAYVNSLPDKIADFILGYSGDGDTSDPWQTGHNYGMREAARMIREKWWALDEGDPTGDEE